MAAHRHGEHGAVPFRSGRFYSIDSRWYFSCREGKEQGPYDNKAEAEAALTLYIRELNTYNSRIVSAR